tara:strand:+ start:286 stop:1548 length:1263 start_codon:yes stop_codon:yes gene_type:complete
MAARTGNLAWKVHFQGLDRKTKIRRPSTTVFDQEGNKLNVPLMMGTDATYIDNLSVSHPNDSQSASVERKKVVAIRIGQDTYYVDVNDLIKPASLNKVKLNPQSFGLGGTSTLLNYVSNLKSSIKSRQDIKGDLEDYLTDLVDYEMTGTGNLSGYNITDLPMASIEKEFGEALGPIFCIKKGLLGKSLGVDQSTQINIVGEGVKTKDYELINSDGKIINVSAKGGTSSSNTYKPSSIMEIVDPDPRLQSRINQYGATQLNVIRTLNNNSAILGPIKAANALGYYNAQSSLLPSTGVRNSSFISKQLQKAYEPMFLTADSEIAKRYREKEKTGGTFTYRTITWCHENFLIKYSLKSANQKIFSRIVNDVTSSNLFFVKLNFSSQVPTFNVLFPGSGSINNVKFRQKNTKFDGGGEKLGFQI